MKRLGTGIGLVLALAAAACAAAAEGTAAGGADAPAAVVERELPALAALCRELHAAPELSRQEARTAARIAAELSATGAAVTTGVGGHGVVGVLRNGPGPVVMLRTDLDALPVREETGLPWASAATGRDAEGRAVPVMHACGHDVHMAVFVGAVRVLAALKDQWSGTLLLVAQLAEEVGTGARALIEDGLFTRFPRPDFALAQHVTPDLDAGVVGIAEGFAFANVDTVDITVRGVGGHGATPHLTIDPVVIAAQLVLALQTIDSREVDPLEGVVVTVGSIHGGSAPNIIPDAVRLQLTIRSYDAAVRDRILASVHRISRHVALAAGAPADRLPEVTLRDEFTPAVYNDPELCRRAAAAFRAALGADAVVARRPEMIGEDFGAYRLQHPPIPSLMFRVGTSDSYRTPGTVPAPLHSGHYTAAVEPSIRTGALAMTALVLELLHR